MAYSALRMRANHRDQIYPFNSIFVAENFYGFSFEILVSVYFDSVSVNFVRFFLDMSSIGGISQRLHAYFNATEHGQM